MTLPSSPSLSVLLPCRNEERLLPRQLAAIIPQLSSRDELLLLDDGSTDRTKKIMQEVIGINVRLISNVKPSGVCAAFNQLGSLARKQWIIGASGNDAVQAGAFDAFRRAAVNWPDCRVIFGSVAPVAMLAWDIVPRLFSRAEMPALWRAHRGHNTNGAGVFIRRDAWGKGYTAGGYMADWWQAFQIAARYGAGFIPDVISFFGPPGECALHGDDDAYNERIEQIIKEARSPECADIADQIAVLDEIAHVFRPRPNLVFFERSRTRMRANV